MDDKFDKFIYIQYWNEQAHLVVQPMNVLDGVEIGEYELKRVLKKKITHELIPLKEDKKKS